MRGTEGALDPAACPSRPGRCRCGVCRVCGYHAHMAVHLPLAGAAPGTAPWHHRFEPVYGSAVLDLAVHPPKEKP